MTSTEISYGKAHVVFYRLVFELPVNTFFRRIALDIEIGTDAKYHVPLLFTPFALTSYRGS